MMHDEVDVTVIRLYFCIINLFFVFVGYHHGRDRTVDGFTTTYAISAYHH